MKATCSRKTAALGTAFAFSVSFAQAQLTAGSLMNIAPASAQSNATVTLTDTNVTCDVKFSDPFNYGN